MDKITTATSTFSVFGNVSELINKIDAIKALFPDFKHEEQKGTLPNGLPTTSHILHNENKAVIIRTYRIDVQYGYIVENNDTIDTFLSFANDVIAKLTQIATPKFNRIAYTDTNFVVRTDDVMAKFNKLFNVANVFGAQGNELQVRVNNVKDVNGEMINCVTIAQDGAAQNKNSGERSSVIFINNDINTLAQEREPRFTWEKSKEILSDLIMVAKERTNKIADNL